MVRPALDLPFPAFSFSMESRSVHARLDIHEEQLQQLQSDVAEIKSVIQSLEADRAEQREFQKFFLNWMKEQDNEDTQGTGEVSLSTGSLNPKSTLEKEEEIIQVSNTTTPPSPPPSPSPSPWFENSTQLSLAIHDGVISGGEVLGVEKLEKVQVIDNAHQPFDKMFQQLLTSIGKSFCQVFFVVIDKGIYIDNFSQTFKVFVRKKGSWFEVLLLGNDAWGKEDDDHNSLDVIQTSIEYLSDSVSMRSCQTLKLFGVVADSQLKGSRAIHNFIFRLLHITHFAGNRKLVLPVPAFKDINGGSHAGNKLAVQEFIILPTRASSFKEAMKMGVELYRNLKSVIKKKYDEDATNVGDEGGFTPNIQENKEGLELLKTTIGQAGYTRKVAIGMDVAASEFYGKDKTYDLNSKEENNNGSQKVSGVQSKDLYKSFASEYPIVSNRDPFNQDDWETYAKVTTECGYKVQIVDDDLLVTNPTRFKKAISEKTCNTLLLKVNQIGSVAESIEAVKMSKQACWGVMASQHSWETEDIFIADLVVGLTTGQIKAGIEGVCLAFTDEVLCWLYGNVKENANSSPEVLSSHLQDIIDIDFGKWARIDPLLARTCIALQRLTLVNRNNLLTNHRSRVFDVLNSLIIGSWLPEHFGYAAADRAISTIYAIHPSPQTLAADLVLKSYHSAVRVDNLQSDTDAITAIQAKKLSRFIYITSHVAMNHMVYIESCVRKIHKEKVKKDKLVAELGVAASEDALLDILSKRAEKEIAYGASHEKNLIGRCVPFLSKLCRNYVLLQKYPELQSFGMLALCRLMIIDADFCEANLQLLLFTVVESAPSETWKGRTTEDATREEAGTVNGQFSEASLETRLF